MTENMAVIPEVWPVAADRAGIWLISGMTPWYMAPVPADSEPHFEIELDLMARGIRDRVALMHSTSWRVDYRLGGLVATYMVVMEADDLVPGIWPGAVPVTLAAMEVVGKPLPHAPDGRSGGYPPKPPGAWPPRTAWRLRAARCGHSPR